MGKFLQAAFPYLGAAEREVIEGAILAIPSDPSRPGSTSTRRDRLLGCLPEAHVVTDEAKEKIRALAAAGGAPPNTPLFKMSEMTGESYTESDWLSDEGVDVAAESNRKLGALSEPARQFAQTHRNEKPPRNEALAVLPALDRLRHALERGGDGAQPLVVETGWTHLAASCEAVARADWLESEPDVLNFARAALLRAAGHETPQPDPEASELFEQCAGSTPSPRGHAAAGLVCLARLQNLANQEVVDSVRRLGEDPCPEVRYEVAGRLGALFEYSRDAFWYLLRRVESTEGSRQIIHAALVGVAYLARHCREQLVPLAKAVFARFRDELGADGIRSACLQIVIAARARDADPFGDELFGYVAENQAYLCTECMNLIQTAAEVLGRGPVDPPDPSQDRLRLSGFGFLERLARHLLGRARELEPRNEGTSPNEWPEGVRGELQAVLQCADELATRVYFASGSFDEKSGDQSGPSVGPTGEEKKRFLQEATPLLDLLAEFGMPQVVHNLLETLAGYVTIGPRPVFLSVARAVRHGQKGGYETESLGATLIVKLVRQYLADHRQLFREDRECREALTDILNTFVKAGWPEALELTFRLEEIFR